jgi:tetratricopeptide (TPR) repeat protein
VSDEKEIDIEKEIDDLLGNFKILAEKKENELVLTQKAQLAFQLGTLYHEQELYANAHHYFSIALTCYHKLNDKQNLASVQGALGSLFIQLGDFPQALEHTENAFAYWQNTTFLNERLACLQNLGIIHLRLSHEEIAVDYILNAMKMAMQLQDEVQFALSIQILLEFYEIQQKYDMLKELKLKALQFWQSMQIYPRQNKTLIDLGVLSEIINQFDDAIGFFKQAYNLAFKQNDAEKMFLAQGFIAECYFKIHELDKARQTYLEAFKLALYLENIKGVFEGKEQMRVALLMLGVDQRKIEEIEIETKQEIEKN